MDDMKLKHPPTTSRRLGCESHEQLPVRTVRRRARHDNFAGLSLANLRKVDPPLR